MILDLIGAYRATFVTGLATGLAANASLLAAQWTNATFAMRLRAVEVDLLVTAGFTAAQEVGVDVIVARSWTVAPSGATAGVLTNNKKVGLDAAMKLAAVQVAGAGGVTNGTLTIDPNPIGAAKVLAGAGVAGPLMSKSWRFDADERNEPIIFQANEGLLVRTIDAMGAGGVVRGIITLEWDEVLIHKR